MSDVINILPFKLTKAQLRVLEEIDRDMESNKPMNRLLQGDVGSGKTVVAMIAAYKAVKSGYQATIMAPTAILASQHLESFQGILEELGIKTELLISSVTKKKKSEILEKLQSGEIDILIGTHAILEENVVFKNLGLVVTDEQHRFGVKQRGTIASKGQNPDVIAMSATPIPRTLALILYGDLDISIIDELPPNRKKIETYAVRKNMEERVNNFIRKQNVYVGEYKGKIDCDEIEKKIRNKYSDVTWVCAEIKGTNLIIHVNENYNRTIKEQENSPYNIIANCDAQIDSIITRTGVGNVKKGDKVKKGDLLISGEVDTYNEFEEIIAKKYVKADGEIYAKVKYEFNKKYKIKEKVKKYGKKYSYFNVSFGDMTILNGEGKNKDILIEKNKLHFLRNYYLPVTFTKITNIPFKYVEVKRNKIQIKTLIDNDFTYYLMTLEQKGYKILEKNVKMEIVGDKYIGKGQVTVVQPFGSLEELSISEEGTTINERD